MTGKHWITISGPARVSSLAENPIDRTTLARFHGVVDDSVQDLAEYVEDQELVRVCRLARGVVQSVRQRKDAL